MEIPAETHIALLATLQMRGDSLELMDSPFASKLDPKLFTYLSTCNSVPAFLSSVTLDLFDNQTFLG